MTVIGGTDGWSRCALVRNQVGQAEHSTFERANSTNRSLKSDGSSFIVTPHLQDERGHSLEAFHRGGFAPKLDVCELGVVVTRRHASCPRSASNVSLHNDWLTWRACWPMFGPRRSRRWAPCPRPSSSPSENVRRWPPRSTRCWPPQRLRPGAKARCSMSTAGSHPCRRPHAGDDRERGPPR